MLPAGMLRLEWNGNVYKLTVGEYDAGVGPQSGASAGDQGWSRNGGVFAVNAVQRKRNQL